LRLATARDARRSLEALESDLELGADAARGSLRGGRGSAADALAAEAALAEFRSRLLRLRGDEKRAAAELERWIGPVDGTPGPLPSLDDLPNRPDILRDSVHLHVDIAPLDARIDLAQAEVELARAARRPGWGVELSYARRGPDYSDMASLQFTVDLPLFARNRQNPVIAARNADLRRARAERDAELAMHTAELHQVVISWQQLGEQIEFLDQEQLPLARERAQATLGSFRAGSGDVKSLVDAVTSETELIVTRSAYMLERGIAWSYLRYLQNDMAATGSTP
jgi:outer membrane protein TolC